MQKQHLIKEKHHIQRQFHRQGLKKRQVPAPIALLNKDHTECTFSLRSGTVEMYTKFLSTKNPKWSLSPVDSAGHVDRFMLHNQPQQQALWGSHGDQMQIINLTITNKQCWQAVINLPQTLWTCGYKAKLLISTFHALTPCHCCAGTFLILVTQLRPITGLLKLALTADLF